MTFTNDNLRPDQEHVLTSWGRGFRDFGEGIRESSAAMWPKFWDDEDRLSDGSPELATVREAALAADLDIELRKACARGVIFCESVAVPRWLNWEQPDRRLVDLTEDDTVCVHALGYMRWQLIDEDWVQSIFVDVEAISP